MSDKLKAYINHLSRHEHHNFEANNTPVDLKTAALKYHNYPRPGKIGIELTKSPNFTLGYTPGVAEPCKLIQRDKHYLRHYCYTANNVAVISNGSAVLGLGNLGAAASMPVMEGKCVIFKYYADIDAVPIVIDEIDPEQFIKAVVSIRHSFGGINLEDIKAPECFYIEEQLIRKLDIPVFHDDQHGTAIVVCAAIINALKVAGKKLQEVRIVINGAGSAGIASATLLKEMGATNIIMCDTQGVIFHSRTIGMNSYKAQHAIQDQFLQDNYKLPDSSQRWMLEDVIEGADIFIGVSAKGALSQNMVSKMAQNPIILALANPEPEILPHEAYAVRPDAIVCTGRSDFPNQVNNMLCFPYIFRAALDFHVKTINIEMKKAAVLALTRCVPGVTRDMVIPKPYFPGEENDDVGIMEHVSLEVAQAAVETCVARVALSLDQYRDDLIKRKFY